MTYSQALAFLDSDQFQHLRQRDYYQKIDRVNQFFSCFGNPHKKMKSILVGGTVGKTSTSYYLARFLEINKFKVGLHISPHLQTPRERLQINKTYISKQSFTRLLTTHKKLIQRINLSYHETLFVLAILYFWLNNVDYTVVEVGLGGKYDPTNSLEPIASVITNIGEDHSELLGVSNLAKLREKVAICRSKNMLITGIQQPSLRQWLDKYAYSHHISVKYIQANRNFQANDLSIAKAAYQCLVVKPLLINPSINLQVPGRFEWLTDQLLIDCAHNKAGLKALSNKLKQEKLDCELIVAPSSNDPKRIERFIKQVNQRLKISKKPICAAGSIFAVGALRNLWRPLE